MDTKFWNSQTEIKEYLKEQKKYRSRITKTHCINKWSVDEVTPEDKLKTDMMLPLRMDKMHEEELYDTLQIFCPQEGF